MNNIKILDCTLRDGGYVNNFIYSHGDIEKIIKSLSDSCVDYIEFGFLKNNKKLEQNAIFTSQIELEKFLAQFNNVENFFTMIVYGTFDLEKILEAKQSIIKGIRVTFKKNEIDEALQYIEKVKRKGYIVSANPTNIEMYKDIEFLELINKVNKTTIDIFALVDTLGVLKSKDLIHYYNLANNNLKSNTTIAFHSHNNLQLSFSNATALLEYAYNSKREIIIDSSIRGMGRGAGNLCTELLMQHLNEDYNKNYNLLPILKAIDDSIEKIYQKTPWGYNVPYYLAAINKCHPNYASYLSEKDSITIDAINSILLSIPNNKKSGYDKNLIEELYLGYQSHKVNDDKTIEFLINELKDKQILILGSGKSILNEQDKIFDFIKNHNVYIISLNFFTDLYDCNLAFISNINRYKSAEINSKKYVITSNILNETKDYEYILNYGSYVNNSKMSDNSLLMLIKVLIKCGIKSVNIAGCDGFDGDDYFDTTLKNTSKIRDIDDRNEIVSIVLKELRNSINIRFITQTKYMVGQ